MAVRPREYLSNRSFQVVALVLSLLLSLSFLGQLLLPRRLADMLSYADPSQGSNIIVMQFITASSPLLGLQLQYQAFAIKIVFNS
jgi:hypothetical protein